MSHVFNINNMSNFNEKINIDELYEKKKNYDLSKLEIFNKLLNRVHTKIKLTSRQRLDVQYCWFAVPEIMIGVIMNAHAPFPLDFHLTFKKFLET